MRTTRISHRILTFVQLLSGYPLLCALWFLAPLAQAAPDTRLNDLRYITEHSPPYNYVEDGELKGPAVDLLLAATARAGSPVQREDILVQPWARGYRTALEGPGTVLFNTLRTQNRETLFKWAGPTGSEKYVLVAARTSGIVINEPSDLHRYRIGAVRDDAGEAYVRELGVPEHAITLSTSVDRLGKMLKAGRIDLWAFGEDGWRQSLANSGIASENYQMVYVLKQNDYYFAFSLDVDDVLVAQMQKALDEILLERSQGRSP